MTSPVELDASEQYLQMARRWFTERWTGKLALADSIFSENVRTNGVHVGVPGPVGRISDRLTAFPDLTTSIEDIFVSGDKLAVTPMWRGTHTGSYGGVAATGKPVVGARHDQPLRGDHRGPAGQAHPDRPLLRRHDRREATRPGPRGRSHRHRRGPDQRGAAAALSSLRATLPVFPNPANQHLAVSLTAEQFRYSFGNAIDPGESDRLFQQWAIPAPGRPLDWLYKNSL
jgi:predicted ester cyclase